jgi:hypothetical protein
MIPLILATLLAQGPLEDPEASRLRIGPAVTMHRIANSDFDDAWGLGLFGRYFFEEGYRGLGLDFGFTGFETEVRGDRDASGAEIPEDITLSLLFIGIAQKDPAWLGSLPIPMTLDLNAGLATYVSGDFDHSSPLYLGWYLSGEAGTRNLGRVKLYFRVTVTDAFGEPAIKTDNLEVLVLISFGAEYRF